VQRNWSKKPQDNHCQACLMRQVSPLFSKLCSAVIKLYRL
jgi:hypothetical protein